MSETFGRASGSRKYSVVVLGLAILCCAVMVLSSLAAAGISFASAAPAGTGPARSSGVTTASGPNTDLHLFGETGAGLGASLDAAQPVASGQQAMVVVTLPLQHVDQLNTFLQAVSNPYSPSYAHFLTDQQFTQSYSPAASDQQAVANYLASNGLVLKYVSPDHLTVAASGSLLQLEKAFSVQFATYSKNGQTFFAPTASPSVPSSLAPWIANVAGLTSYNFNVQPQVVLNTGSTSHADVATAGSGVEDYPNQNTYEFQLNQLWNATGNHSAGVVPSFAKGVVIATGLWDLNNSPSPAPQYCPYSITDVNDFFQGLTGTPENMPSELPAPIDHANYNVTGDTTQGPGTGDCVAGLTGLPPTTATEELDFEMTIDQEWSGEDAPGATIEPTYVGGDGVTTSDANLELLIDWIAAGNIPNLSALSLSFGGGESTDFETGFTELAAQGVTVLASSGDGNGAAGFEGAEAVCDTGLPGEYSWNTEGATSIDYPGSSPNVLSVGGTANMAYATPGDPGAVLAGQTVWNWCPSTDSGESAGSTGGVSSTFTEPAYQAADPIVNKAMEWAMNVTNTGNFTDGLPPTGCGTGSPGSGCDDVVAASPTARAIPDLAGPAANNTGYFGQSWVSGYGGTSFSSPSVAGAIGSIIAFDGHKVGFFNTALYSLEQQYLDTHFAGLPFPVAPTYFVDNYSNAFFNGGTYNTSAGWGVPQAYNIALLLGKPFISTNPQGPATVGASYPVSAAVKDDRQLTNVNVSYLEPGASSWANVSLTLKSGTLNVGTWSGAIPAPAGTGVLKYCVYGVDSGMGNSWSPYNQSAWAATGGKNVNFGCTTPSKVNVHAPTTYTLTFSEKGLVSGTSWGVTVNSTLMTSTAAMIKFHLINGVYSYSVGAVSGYTVSPTTGSVTLSGSSVTVPIKFTAIKGATYPLSFVETGLPSGHAWSVTVTKFGERTTTTNTIVFPTMPNGTYTYRIAVAYPQDSYKTPFSGKATVSGAPDTVNVKFTQAQFKVTFDETGLSPGTKWTVDVGTGPKTVSGTGTSLSMTLANGTFSWTASANTGSYNTPSGSFTVNGTPIVVPVTFHSVTGGPAEIMDHPSVTTVRPVGDSPSVAVGTPKGEG
jgi:hypothetical protein